MSVSSGSGVLFSPDGSDVIDRHVEVHKARITDNVDDVFEVCRCVQWITDNNFQKISLQFPDELLHASAEVASKLQKETSATIFILGDTSYGSCCVDEVAGQHYDTDSIIHYGHACLSPTSRYPVLYVFGRNDIDTVDCFQKMTSYFRADDRVVLVYDVIYEHAMERLKESVVDGGYCGVLFSTLNYADTQRAGSDSSHDQAEESGVTLKCGRRIAQGWTELAGYAFLYIGQEGATLNNLIMTFNQCVFHSYSPDSGVLRRETLNVNRALMKRFRMVEVVKDARIVGIVAGTLGVSDYISVIDRLRTILKTAGKKTYTFVVGKVNVPKMANFMEVDAFVLVACPENSLLDSSEFYKPIVTPYEVELACNLNREWSSQYVSDFRELLSGGSAYMPMPVTMEMVSDVSLVTGAVRTLGVNRDSPTEGSSALLKRNDVLTVTQSNTAGEYLAGRSWSGLQQNLGETAVVKAVEGQTGIASGYTNKGGGGLV